MRELAKDGVEKSSERNSGEANSKNSKIRKFGKWLLMSSTAAIACCSLVVPAADRSRDSDTDDGSDSDSDMDTDSDTESDTDTDTESNTDTDTNTADAGIACAEASTGSFSGLIVADTPLTVGGYVFDYISGDGSNATITISCGGNPVVTEYLFPKGIETVIDVTADDKLIGVTPTTAAALASNVEIVVENM